MKKVIILFFLSLVLFPINISAKVEVNNLDETLKKENITSLYSNYSETNEQVVLYLFYSSTCPHCKNLLNYLNSITNEYGYMFKLRSYEVSKNKENLNLKDSLVTYLKANSNGVPFLIIGNEAICGFSENNREYIFNLIKEEYNKDIKDKSDVLYDYYQNSKKRQNISKENNNNFISRIREILTKNTSAIGIIKNIFNLIKNSI